MCSFCEEFAETETIVRAPTGHVVDVSLCAECGKNPGFLNWNLEHRFEDQLEEMAVSLFGE